MTTSPVREAMSGVFDKFHLGEPLPFPAVLHRFIGPDVGDPHDHPWSFQSHVLSGGYVEQVFTPLPDASGWSIRRYDRLPGTSHHVEATTIHRIIRLLAPECWTLILPGPCERVSCFWRMGANGVESRRWDEEY